MQARRQRGSKARRRSSLGTTAPRVLVVDPDPPEGEEASAILGQLGYDVLVATSATQALRYLAVRSYDCILVDLATKTSPGQ